MNTYAFQTMIRDLSPVIDIIIKNSPSLLSLIGTGPAARATKHEYLIDELNSYETTVGVTFGTSDITLTVGDGTIFRVNDILGFEEDTGEAFLETVRVTDINGNDLTVSRQYNGQSKVQVEVNDKVKMIQRPTVENAVGGQDEGKDRATAYNYTEIMTKYATISRTKQQVATYGLDVGDELNYQVDLRAKEMVLMMERGLMLGTKHAGTDTQPRTAGGIITEILQSGSALKKNVNGALGSTDIDDAVESILTASGLNPDTIVCHPKMARKISAFDTSGVQVMRGDPATGRAVFQFRSAIPVNGLQNIVINNQWPKDMVLVANTSKILTCWMQRPKDMDSTQPGQDGFSRKIVSEHTFEFKNFEKCHKLLYNCNL